MKDYRRPFAYIPSVNAKKIKKPYEIRTKTFASCLEPPISEGHYTFESSDTDLLIAIDNNDVNNVKKALQQDKMDVNALYVIPSWEVPEADKPLFQTFLHRALWEHSADVFEFLLKKGANPRIKGHCHTTVIDDLFNGHTNNENILRFGKMLVDAGMKSSEIEKRTNSWNKKDKSYAQKLIHYANTKIWKISEKRPAQLIVKDLSRIKD